MVLVNDRPTGLRASSGLEPRVRVFPWDDTSVLLAVGSEAPWTARERDDDDRDALASVLWHVPCQSPERLGAALKVEGADFSWAAFDPDDNALYYGGVPGGVRRLDLKTGRHGDVGRPPPLDDCAGRVRPLPVREYVVDRLDAGSLLIVSGGPCGHNSEFLGRGLVIESPDEDPVRRPQDFVASVFADSRGRVWVGDGGRCRTQDGILDRGHPGLWRSNDDGESWTWLSIEGIERGIQGVWAAASVPEQMLVWEACCESIEGGDDCEGGALLRSDDGGASWREIVPNPSMENFGVAVGPELLELEVHAVSRDGSGDSLLVSHDGGRSWSPQRDRRLEVDSVRRSAEVRGRRYDATADGLLRESGPQRRVVLRPSSGPALEPVAAPTGHGCDALAGSRHLVVVDWPRALRRELARVDAGPDRGLLVLARDGCEFRLLPDCHVAGRYEYRPRPFSSVDIPLADVDELWANLPQLAARDQPWSGPYLLSVKALGTARATTWDPGEVTMDGDCEGATHILDTVELGAGRFSRASYVEPFGPADLDEVLIEFGDSARCVRERDIQRRPARCSQPWAVLLIALDDDLERDGCPGPTGYDGLLCSSPGRTNYCGLVPEDQRCSQRRGEEPRLRELLGP